jgi:TM2 domain-containing membrane protein YozV
MRKKNPVIALVLSAFVFAGAGQIYNKQYKKGMFLVLIYGILLFLILKPVVLGYINYIKTCINLESIDISKINIQFIQKPDIILTIVMTVVWLFAVIDAYKSAKIYNSVLEKQENTII